MVFLRRIGAWELKPDRKLRSVVFFVSGFVLAWPNQTMQALDGVDERQDRFLARFIPNQGTVRAFIRSCVWDRATCDDIFQEVALVLWREFDRYDPGRPFGPWARGVTARTIRMRLRQRRNTLVAVTPEAMEAIEIAFATLATSPSRKEEALQRCVELLPDKSRQLVRLRYRESLKVAQIAARIGSSTDAVQKALTRLRDALHRCVERRMRTQWEVT